MRVKQIELWHGATAIQHLYRLIKPSSPTTSVGLTVSRLGLWAGRVGQEVADRDAQMLGQLDQMLRGDANGSALYPPRVVLCED